MAKGTRTISPDAYREGFAKTTKPAKKRNKYGAVKTRGRDGRLYDSKLEAKVADELLLRKEVGMVNDYLCQVPIVFACGKRWRCDFLVFFTITNSVIFIEVKGREANDREWSTVKKLLQHEKPWIYERLEVRTK